MERWRGRVAVVTGASAGIGAVISRVLVENGVKVIGMARRVDKIQALSKELQEGSKGEGSLCAVECDVADKASVLSAFQTVEESHGGVDVLINNAGVLGNNSLLEGSVEDWSHIMAVNVVGLCHCTKLAVESMRKRNVEDGQIIHISSYSAHVVPSHEKLHFYSASKHAVRALTEGLRKELGEKNSKIRVSSISPGLVKSDIYDVGLGPNISNFVYATFPSIEADDVAQAVVNILSTKPHVQIHDMIIKPVGEPL